MSHIQNESVPIINVHKTDSKILKYYKIISVVLYFYDGIKT